MVCKENPPEVAHQVQRGHTDKNPVACHMYSSLLMSIWWVGNSRSSLLADGWSVPGNHSSRPPGRSMTRPPRSRLSPDWVCTEERRYTDTALSNQSGAWERYTWLVSLDMLWCWDIARVRRDVRHTCLPCSDSTFTRWVVIRRLSSVITGAGRFGSKSSATPEA